MTDDSWRRTCPRCGRFISLTFGGVRLSPHNTGKGGPPCDGSRMTVQEHDAITAQELAAKAGHADPATTQAIYDRTEDPR